MADDSSGSRGAADAWRAFVAGLGEAVLHTVSFIVGAVVSLGTREAAAEARFDDEKLRTYLGIGAE